MFRVQMKFIRMCLLLLVMLLWTGILDALHCTDFNKACKNGECIKSELFCDGKIDCIDGSDETPDFCIHLKCPQFAFQCAYGACINREFKCNNIRNCADNSDESGALCNKEDRLYRNGKCLKHYFQCNSGHCIPVEDVCDGKTNCSDGSDETVDLCAGGYCPDFAFRCGYGACISGAAKCDGILDCLDGSDEVAILCGKEFIPTTEQPLEVEVITPVSISTATTRKQSKTSTTTTTTTTPKTVIGTATTPTSITATAEKPKTGCVIRNRTDLIVILDATNEIVPQDEYIDDYQGISYNCYPKNLLEGETTNYCFNGQWITSHPTCIRYCPSRIIQGITFESECTYNGCRISCNDYLRPGTIVHVNCKVGYRKPNRILQEYLRCDEYGEWDYSPFRCHPVCGVAATEVQPFVIDGSKINNTYVPWHVPIYSRLIGRYEQICSGTIINAKLVVSAAHCFWNVEEGRPYNYSYFSVAAGKYFRDYSLEEPLHVQFFNLSEIRIPNSYLDTSHPYQNDIALLVLDRFIEFNSYVKPICIEWLSYRESLISSAMIGKIAGWSKIGTNQSSSKELRMTELETVSSNTDCLVGMSVRSTSMIANDKFCAISSNGDGFCGSNSGAGLVIPKKINGVEIYFLWGILTNDLSSADECDSNRVMTFTNIQFYSSMIQDYELRYRPK